MQPMKYFFCLMWMHRYNRFKMSIISAISFPERKKKVLIGSLKFLHYFVLSAIGKPYSKFHLPTFANMLKT